MNYNKCLSLVSYLPHSILQDICFKLNFNLSDKSLACLIDEYNYSKKERKNENIRIKSNHFYQIILKALQYMIKNYRQVIKKDLEEYKMKNNLYYFFYHKQLLIDFLYNDIISKKDFIELTYILMQLLNIKPFEKCENICELIFNYQYYNALIKKENKRRENNDYIEFLYTQKDASIKNILYLCKKENIQIYSYYIEVDSNNLFMYLFEIYIPKLNITMHSINENIKNELKNNNLFQRDILKSKTDKYVNSKY